MRKSITLILALASLLVVLFAGTALAGTTVVEPLMAGQNTQVGTVTISDDGTSLTVEYDITEDGWFLSTTHVYVGLKAPAKSAPGQFPYKHEGVYDTTDTFVVPIVDGKTVLRGGACRCRQREQHRWLGLPDAGGGCCFAAG